MTLTKFSLFVSVMSIWFAFLFCGCEVDRVQARTADYALSNGLPIPAQAYSVGEVLSVIGLCACCFIIGLCIMAIRYMFKDWRRTEKLKRLAVWENN